MKFTSVAESLRDVAGHHGQAEPAAAPGVRDGVCGGAGDEAAQQRHRVRPRGEPDGVHRQGPRRRVSHGQGVQQGEVPKFEYDLGIFSRLIHVLCVLLWDLTF